MTTMVITFPTMFGSTIVRDIGRKSPPSVAVLLGISVLLLNTYSERRSRNFDQSEEIQRLINQEDERLIKFERLSSQSEERAHLNRPAEKIDRLELIRD